MAEVADTKVEAGDGRSVLGAILVSEGNAGPRTPIDKTLKTGRVLHGPDQQVRPTSNRPRYTGSVANADAPPMGITPVVDDALAGKVAPAIRAVGSI